MRSLAFELVDPVGECSAKARSGLPLASGARGPSDIRFASWKWTIAKSGEEKRRMTSFRYRLPCWPCWPREEVFSGKFQRLGQIAKGAGHVGNPGDSDIPGFAVELV